MNKKFKNPYIDQIWNGILRENPIFVLVIGMCPVLAVTTTASNAIGMGLSSTFVLIMSNIIISALRKVIPDGVRMPAYIVIVATFVTVTDFIMEAFTPGLYKSLGVYIPLIVVNCIILGRAEAYANQNPVGMSAADGVGMGIGFTVALLLISSFREILGAGEWFGNTLYVASDFFAPIGILVKSPGAFFVLACIVAAKNKWKWNADKKDSECTHNCLSCHGGCAK
ncbi:MAG: electron transport complex subunit E [Lachnospiraceae bacterium]|nr:electron transport complex subunit E [Lachnospiraceae bacterium]